MKKKTRKNPIVIGFAEQIQAVSQRTKLIATSICRITGVFTWVLMAYGLQAQSLSTDDFSGTYCLGASFNVNYTASGDFGSNTFKAYVSKDNFVTSVEIGSKSVSGTQSNGSISVTIPGNLTSANNYRIRVVSISAPISGDSDDNGTNLSITALTITANNPSASIYCVGDPISVDFTTSCALSSGNTFTLQLSDKTGSFASPTTVATKTGTTGSTITGNIPDVPYGSAYKVRVVSSNPNTNITWTANTTALRIGNAKLSNLKSVGSTFCPGEVMSLGYTFASNEELNPGNITSVQMSDASGSFATPTVLGSLGSTATSGTIYAIIPYVVTGGTGYRIRIVSSNTATIGCIEYGPYTITKVRDFTDPLSSYVCAGGTLNLSTDAGFTSYAWQKVSSPPFSLTNIGTSSTVSLAKNGSNVYIGTAKGLYVSSDGGSTFSKNSQVIDTFINKIFVNGAKVYAATANGIYYSSDSGTNFNTNFTSGNNGLPIPNISAVATNADGTIIYAGTTSGLSRSTNSGTSFAAVSIGQSVSDTITVSGIFVSGSTVYLSTGAGLKISYDDGATFPVSIGSGTGLLPSANATSVFVKDGIIYVGTDSGLSVSTNGGGSWTNYNAINNGLAGNIVNSIAVANNLIYVSTDKGFSVGNLGGDGFVSITAGLTNTNISGVIAEAASSTVNNVYLVAVGGGFASNTFTLSNLGVSTSSYTQSISPSDSWSSFQVRVEKSGCYLTSNQAQVADIPPDFTSVTSVTPTKCGGVSGSIILSGLIPNTQYQLLYTGPYQGIPKSGDTITVTPQGTDTIFLLGPGAYTNIYMKSLVKRAGQTEGCTNPASSIVISDSPQPTAVTASTVSPICSGQNLSISLTSTLAANEVYRWYTDAGGTILASPDITTGNTFTLTNPPTSSGTLYVRKRNNNTLCNGDLLAINYTVSQAVQISSSVASQPSSATATDGSLIIAITSSNNLSGAYTLSYNKVVNSVSTPQTVSGLTLASFPYTLSNLSVGNYTNITVTANNGCPSNVIASTALVGLPSPTAIGGAILQSQNCGIIGVDGGYFQKVELPYAASSNWITENAGAIAVGRIRQSIYNSAAKNETVEMRGYIKFDLSSIPTNATIDKVELRPRSMFGGFQTVGDVTISYAVGDLKFDVTQVSATNYSPYVGYSDQVFDDLYDPKYNDFVIGANATGALTDLGAQAVNDVQIRLANDKKFELGLALSGTDTILPLTQFNGIVFAPSSYQKLCITYHLNDFGDLPEPKYATNSEGGLVGPSHRVDLLDVNPDVNTTLLRPALYIGATPPDAEADGQVNDNANGTADEDLTSASFSGKLIAGESVTLTVPVTNNIPQPAKLSVFIDWNGDGIFNNTSERYDQDVLPATQVSASSTPIPYTNSFAFNLTVPQLDNSYAVGVRVRLSTGTGLDAYGPAPNGEVEDFVIDVLSLDYGDLPDPTAGLGIDNYQTRRADNGARHAVPTTVLVFLGNTVDKETDAVPSVLADGDDKNNINADDEDGIRFLTSPMVPGQPVTIEYTATNNSSVAAKLYLFADFNNDGVNSMEDIPVVFTSGDAVVAANAGNVTRQLTFLLPQNAVYGGEKAMFRFRFTTDVDPLPHGLAQDGEVEDYLSSDFQLTDWADLPEPKYITDATGGIVGPSHRIQYIDVDPTSGLNYQNTLYIGATAPDAEKDGKPSHLAAGDDLSYQDDEDLSYLNFLNPGTNQPFPLVADEPIRLRIPVVNNSPDNPATLWAFMDWNGDGDFEDEGEKMSESVDADYSGNIDFDFTIPKVTKSDSIGIRIRLTSGVGIDAYGPAPDGEVEDFVVEIRTIDYGDLPDATAGLGIDNYQTRRLDNGARHAVPVVPLVYLGSTVDAEKDGVPSALADGDDKNNINADDEDGIRFLTSPMVPGQPVTIEYTATNNSSAAAKLYLYADFNNDGVNSIENVPVAFTSGDAVVAANAGTVTQQLTFILPQNAEYGGDKAMFRFRFTTDVDPLPYGLAQDGEIEDYLSSDILLNDWADLPEPKYITDATGGIVGPSHRIHYLDIDPSAGENYLNTLYIGATPPDSERDGQPTHLANGDNNSYQADEDLSYLNFLNPTTNQPFPLVADEPIRLRIPVVNNSASNPATLWAFMDWNGDGDFEDEGEKMSQTLATNYIGNIDFDFTIPKVAKSDSIGIRIRLTSGVGIDAYGPAPDGEVEDFVVEILTLDYGDLPDATTGIGNNDYQTLRSRNGARHGIPVVPLVVMGAAVDSEVDGQPSAKSTGDDQNPQVGQDDEDGIVFLTPLVPGYTSQVAFTGRNQSNADATLYVYTDWTNDGVLDLATTYTLAANSTASAQSISFYVPANATFEGGKAFFRFRLTADPEFNAAPSANGVAIDGEVEDYYVPLFKLGNLVWEDRNNNGFQDAEEIQLGTQNVRVVMRFGGIDPSSANYDEVTQNTLADPNTLTPLGAGVDLIPDYVIDTFTNSKGLYGFTGMIEGNYQIIAVDTFGLTPTRFDWITNGTEEDHDSDGKPLKNSWEYATGERRQSKSQQIKILESQIGILETGILDQTSSQLLDPNQFDGFPDNKVEHRLDFGYIGLDLGDLAESGNDPSVSNFVTSENGTKPEGPKHIVTPDLRLGKYQDVEWQGQADQDAGEEFLPQADAGGDDPIADFSNYPGSAHDPSQSRHWPFHVADDHDDEDGIKFLSPMVAGYDAVISVKYSAKINLNGPDAYLHAWMDWNGDGNFDDGAGNVDPDEHILFSMLDGKPTILEANTQAVRLEMSYLTSANDSITLTFKVPANAKYNNGNVLSRFRISFDPQLGPNGILPANLNFPDPQPGAESSSVPGGIIPYGEVEDYFIALAKVTSTAWQDQNYNGKQDEGEATFQGQPVKLEFAGLDGVFGTSDDYTYLDTTDINGKFVFCGLIGSNIYDPSGLDTAVYRLIVNVPPNTVPAFGLPTEDACSPLDFANSDGSTANADPGVTQMVFSISNPAGQCDTDSTGAGGDFPETQTNGTINFGFSAFDYGDLPVQGTNYLTLRDSLSAAFNNRFGPRHIIQARLYLGSGVDGERDGQPDADAGSKNGGDDGVAGRFLKGTGADDETGIRLLTPLIPGEMAYLQVSYTSQDTVPEGGYTNPDAFLRSFIDFNGDGDLDDLSDIVDYSLIAPGITGPFSPTTNNVQLAGGISQVQVLAFRVPVSATYRNGIAYMRHRLSWNSDPLGPDNNLFHLNTAPFVDTTLTYPKGEVEDYAIPLAKIGNLAWFDHDVFGDQDDNEAVVDSLEMVLVYGGIDPSTGTFDEVGYQRSIQSAGNVADIVYNLSIVPSGNATTAPLGNDSPGHIEKTASSPAQDSGLYSFKGLIPGTYYLIPKKYLLSDSASFTNAWPKHRILTISDNPGVDDQHDNDGMPGALFTLNDGNSKDPEVAIAAQPINETGKQDTADASRMNALMPAYGVFPDSLYNQTIDLGWVDEPNVEANLDVVGVYFPTSKICGNFNVIMNFCVKNPKEVPLDSLQAFLNLKDAYGSALYAGTKPKVSIADGNLKKLQAGAKAQLVLNPNFDGNLDNRLLLPNGENANFALKGDSAVCIRIEFEIDPTQTQNYPWMSQGNVKARAVGFNKQTGAKRPLIDYRFFHPRFGKAITVFDSTDNAVQNDECWIKTKWNSSIKDVTVALNSSCESTFSANVFVPNFVQTCGSEKFTEGSFYAVIIQDKWTKETIWASDDPSPFDAKKYLDRKLTYTVISVANSCAEISGDFFLVDKIAPVVQCATNTDRKVVGNAPTGTYTFVCTDIDSILNVKRSWSNPNYPYYTGIAVAKDSCGQAWLDNVKDELEVLADCDASANAGFVYARIRRVFTFTDDQDNQTTCTQIISFRRPQIVLPECKVEIPNNLAGASKDLIPADLIKSPFNLAESVPYYFNGAGKRIYLTGRDYCGIAVNYTDEIVFKTGECGRKIIRHWTLLDWCYGVINNQASYPVYHLVPNADADCYSSIAWDPSLHMLTWEQHLIVGDNGRPIVSIPDYDRDGVQGSGYQGGESDRPEDDKSSTYDAGDVLTISTGPMECKGSYLFTRKDLDIIEQSKWCFDLQVVQRSPILDPFKRPKGSYEWVADPGVSVKGDCDKGYSITGIPMLGNWFLRLHVYDVCYSDTLIYYPIRAVDKIAPVMKSDNKLILSLNNGGLGFVSAEQFDEGSWDNCTRLEWKRLRRPVTNLVSANFIGIKGVVDANENGKIDAYSSSTTSPQDYVDVNRNRQADPEEYFKIDANTSLLMTPLMDSVPFFCADRGSVMLELWGNDNAGNRSYSWGNVLIEDKTIPVCSAPWTISVSCDDKSLYFIDSKVASAKAFGDVLITSGNLCADFDTAYAVVKKLKCGAGTIERIWTLTKQTSKGSVVVTCKQIIRVLPLREYNICFPKDVDQRDCKTPVIDTAFTKELGCDILAVNVTDRLYDASNDECYKIFRTYTVIDWCAYDDNCGDPTADGIVYVVDRSYSNYGQTPIYVLVRDADQDQREEFYLSLNDTPKEGNLSDSKVGTDNDEAFVPAYCENAFSDNPYGLPVGEFYHAFQYTQIIKVYDDVKPVVTGDQAKFCIRDGGDCLADLKMIVKGTDNCTDQVTLETNLLAIAPFQTREAGSMIGYSTSRWSTKVLAGGQFEINVSNLPQGKHDLIVVVRDECGNLSEPTRIPFTVEDCKGPAPICINGLSTNLMPDGSGGGIITVWATDFVASKVFDCNGQGPETSGNGKLVTKYSINRVGSPASENQTSMVFNCKEAGKIVLVELHAWDNAGNHDFCVSFVEVQDNRKVCETGNANLGSIIGVVTNDQFLPLSGVAIDMNGASALKQTTANSGVFAFTGLSKGADFSLSAQLDKDHINGVSTFDLVVIQKHILGVKLIDNPYRQIAADVNNSKSITTLDMIQVRKLILQVDDKFKSVPSWKFVDASYKFPNASNPFGAEYPEVINVNNLNGNVKADFVAIKMGDVNGNASTVNGIAATEIRSNRHLLLTAEEQAMKVDGSYEVAIRAKDLQSIQGYQFTLTYAQNLVELEGIEYGVAKADNFGIFKNKGAITTSWNLNSGVSAAGNEVLFTLKLKAKANTKLSEVLKLSSSLTPAEAYDKENESIGIKLSFGAITSQDFTVLRQNKPNPFSDETSIGFYLPKATKGILSIRDSKGSLIYRVDRTYSKGENKIVLKQAELRASGVLYYTLETADFVDTKKMILLNP